MAGDLVSLVTDAAIRRLADSGSYKRGKEYFSDGHVESLKVQGESIHALVSGSNQYSVTLTAGDGDLDYSCDCPVGRDYDFCKHCVAVALAWLSRAPGKAMASSRGVAKKAKSVKLADAEKILIAEDHGKLVRMVLDWAKNDERVRGWLIIYAARHFGREAAISAVRRAFEKAIEVGSYLKNGDERIWMRGVNDAIDSIEQLLDDGYADDVMEMCERALLLLVGAFRTVDDPGGRFDSLRHRLEVIHFRSCQEAKPDPVELAIRLFEYKKRIGCGVFFDAAARYAKILGDEGTKAYRELAEIE